MKTLTRGSREYRIKGVDHDSVTIGIWEDGTEVSAGRISWPLLSQAAAHGDEAGVFYRQLLQQAKDEATARKLVEVRLTDSQRNGLFAEVTVHWPWGELAPRWADTAAADEPGRHLSSLAAALYRECTHRLRSKGYLVATDPTPWWA